MELDWSTLSLEVLNFLILVWILKRFLYRPVLDLLARRRAETEEAMAATERAREASETLKARYENRLGEWAKEREAALRRLREEMDQERRRRREEILRALEEEREKARVADERRQREFRASAEAEALALAARFAGKLLTRTASPQSSHALVALALEGIDDLEEARRTTLRKAGSTGARGLVQTAHPLLPPQRAALERSLHDLFGEEARWEWTVVPELIAGLRIVFGAWELAANVRDELHGFAALAHEPARH